MGIGVAENGLDKRGEAHGTSSDGRIFEVSYNSSSTIAFVSGDDRSGTGSGTVEWGRIL